MPRGILRAGGPIANARPHALVDELEGAATPPCTTGTARAVPPPTAHGAGRASAEGGLEALGRVSSSAGSVGCRALRQAACHRAQAANLGVSQELAIVDKREVWVDAHHSDL